MSSEKEMMEKAEEWLKTQEDKENTLCCQMWEPAKGFDSWNKPTNPTLEAMVSVVSHRSQQVGTQNPYLYSFSILVSYIWKFLVSHWALTAQQPRLPDLYSCLTMPYFPCCPWNDISKTRSLRFQFPLKCPTGTS